MFCSACGNQVSENLSFCNQCGAKLNGGNASPGEKLSEASFNTLVGSMVAVPIAGIGVIIGFLAVMRESGFSPEITAVFVAAGFAILIAVEAVFIWLILRNTGKAGKIRVDKTNQLNQVEIKTLGEAQNLDYTQPFSAVTEHTTRSLEPALRETKKQ
jgi:uncharacterized membrane protein YvbJ